MSKYECDNKYFLKYIKCALFKIVFYLKIHKILLLFYINEINKKCDNLRIFRDELSIKIRKTQKCLYIFDTTKLFSLRNNVNFLKIHFDFVNNNNNQIEIFDSNNMKIAFIDIKI